MEELNNTRILDLEPVLSASKEPLIDALTKKLTAAFLGDIEIGILNDEEEFILHLQKLSFTICPCENASSEDFFVRFPNGVITSGLALHYLAYHRTEVLDRDIVIINQFQYGEAEPTDAMLCPS